VRFHCAHCRAIDKVSESPLASAPAFRNLRLKYAVADLQRPLLQAEPVHPRLDLKADQVEDVMAYASHSNNEGQRRIAWSTRSTD
jgi:cytochrome c